MVYNQEEQEKNVIKWNEDDKNLKLRTNYPLNSESIIFDVGAFDGMWAFNMYNLYFCNIFAFEPVSEIYNKAYNLLGKLPKINLYQVGLGGETREELIGIDNDGSSLFISGGNREKIKIVAMKEMMSQLKINHVDLIKINVEGAEFELMDHVIKEGLQEKFDNFQIQFHAVVENYDERIRYIRDELSKTHELTYCYDYIWENWKLKQGK